MLFQRIAKKPRPPESPLYEFSIKIKSYLIRIATSSLGFNAWRRNIRVISEAKEAYGRK
jgi:hypothetical protein